MEVEPHPSRSGAQKMMSYLEKAYQVDLRDRAETIANFSPQQVAIASKDIQQGVVCGQNGVRVTAFKVKHAHLEDSFGFRVDYKGHSVVISGDMASNENFVKYAQGADVVIHEMGVARPELLEKGPEIRQLIATHHSTPEEQPAVLHESNPSLPSTRTTPDRAPGRTFAASRSRRSLLVRERNTLAVWKPERISCASRSEIPWWLNSSVNRFADVDGFGLIVAPFGS